MSPFSFCRYIGCDTLQFGNYGLLRCHQIISLCRLIMLGIKIKQYTVPNDLVVREQKSYVLAKHAVSGTEEMVKTALELLNQLTLGY